jgi:uncharacterized protein YggE
MESLLNNKRFIQFATIFALFLALFTAMKFINEIKRSDYVGRGSIAPNVITVTGQGEVMAVSDIATVSFTLTKDASTSKQAQSDLNDQVTKVLSYLKTKKIDDKDIKSEYGGVNPKYGPSTPINCFAYPCPQPDAKIIGYTATQSITVKIRDVDTANDVRTGLTTVGVVNISGPNFSIDDEEVYTDQARSKAIADAREKAEKLARELGVHLGHVTSFSENGGGYPMMYAGKSMMAQDIATSAPAPELPKGENKITSNVTITYEIR